jgi:hypothetical protein
MSQTFLSIFLHEREGIFPTRRRSDGTKRMRVEFGRTNWIEKARQQPDKVRMVLDKICTDGLLPTVEAVFNKLDQPLPLTLNASRSMLGKTS